MSDQHPNGRTGIFYCWHNHRCDCGAEEQRKKQIYEINKVEISNIYICIFKEKVDEKERKNEESYGS